MPDTNIRAWQFDRSFWVEYEESNQTLHFIQSDNTEQVIAKFAKQIEAISWDSHAFGSLKQKQLCDFEDSEKYYSSAILKSIQNLILVIPW